MSDYAIFITSLIFVGLLGLYDLGVIKHLMVGKWIPTASIRIFRIIIVTICIFSFVQLIIKYITPYTAKSLEGYSPSTTKPVAPTKVPESSTSAPPTKAPGSDGIIAGGYVAHEGDQHGEYYETDYAEKLDVPAASEQQFKVDNLLIEGSPIWREPGSLRYPGTGYVPSYEDSVHLNSQFQSKPEHLSSTPYLNGGFCSALANNPLQLDDKCGSLPREICASTECCVLLGGQKCVKGNANGPFFKDNYSDFLVQNKEYYYYQGKCFGNCPS